MVLVTVISINLCAKKRGSGKLASNKAGATNVLSIKGTTANSKKSSKQVSNSPLAPSTRAKKSPDENVPDKNNNNNNNEKTGKTVTSVEKLLKEGGDGGKKTAGKEDEEDSFEAHKPVAREAKRAEEIKKRGYVDTKRKDYKTLRNDLPSSDFDKSLGLPEIEDKKK
uniref:Uncharacterized protein n=1 Tax=Panagrolaimus sp. ES5 TaxID=591445 RepID=A0AC34GRC7_9BILA